MARNPSSNVNIRELNSLQKLKDTIKGRTVCVIARGGSVKTLEERIEEFKDYDVVWASMNLFKPAEDILAKIGKSLDLVSDCSTVQNAGVYEPSVRMPRFKAYLEKGKLLFISELVIEESFKMNDSSGQTFLKIYEKHKNQIATIDDIFNCPEAPNAIWDAPPNSITLLFAACMAGGAKKIITFGYDGLSGALASERTFLDRHAVNTYYRADLEKEDRIVAAGVAEIGSLATDSFFFERDFAQIYRIYSQTYNNNCEIVNCSPTSMFTVIRKIDYDKVHEELK